MAYKPRTNEDIIERCEYPKCKVVGYSFDLADNGKPYFCPCFRHEVEHRVKKEEK